MTTWIKPNYKTKTWKVAGNVVISSGPIWPGLLPDSMKGLQEGSVDVILPLGTIAVRRTDSYDYSGFWVDWCNLPGCTKDHTGGPDEFGVMQGQEYHPCPNYPEPCPLSDMTSCENISSHVHTYYTHWGFYVGVPGASEVYWGLIPIKYTVDEGLELAMMYNCDENYFYYGRAYSFGSTCAYNLSVSCEIDMHGANGIWYDNDDHYKNSIIHMRKMDRSLSHILDQSITIDEYAHGALHIEGTVGGHKIDTTTSVTPSLLVTEDIRVVQAATCGYPGGYAHPMVTTEISRDGGGHEWSNLVWENEFDGSGSSGAKKYNKLILNDSVASLYVKMDPGYVPMTGQGWGGDATIISRCGAFSVDYSPLVLDMLGNVIATSYQFNATVERIPSYTATTYNEDGTIDTMGHWDWDQEHVWTGGSHTFTWLGWWTVEGGVINPLNSQPYNTSPFSSEFIHLPQAPTPGERMRFGGVRITNLGSTEPNFTGEIYTPEFGDWRVLGMPDTGELTGVPALRIHLADEGIQETPILRFHDIGGWIASNCTATPAVDGLEVQLTGTDPYIEYDASAMGKWLHGTRFAKIHWYSDAPATIKITISGKWWILHESSAGEHTSEIDLCRPNCTLGTGGSPGQPGLQIDPASGKLLIDSVSGKLLGDCCCGEGTSGSCTAAVQAQSLIPIVLPKNIDLPTPAPRPHGDTWPIGWGVGKIRTVRVEFLTAGVNYELRDIHLYRKTAAEGGFTRVIVMPQSSFPHTNDGTALLSNKATGITGAVSGAGDVGIYYAGLQTFTDVGEPRTWECFQIPICWIIIDGAIVLEGSMGGPEYISGASVPEPYWAWNYFQFSEPSLGGLAPFYPLDDYDAPSGQVTNGIVTVEPIAAPWEDFPLFLMAQLDYRDSSITDGMELTMSVKCDVFTAYPHVGSPFGGMVPKVLGGQITGLVFEGGAPTRGPVSVNAPNGVQSIRANRLGWYRSARVQSVGGTTLVEGTHTVNARNRWPTRVVVDKGV